jgi:hypothetical protein
MTSFDALRHNREHASGWQNHEYLVEFVFILLRCNDRHPPSRSRPQVFKGTGNPSTRKRKG